MDLSFITPKLHELRANFNQNGFDLRLVGGIVRDILAGETPKDIDLCTDATPAQQIDIYNQYGYHWIATGIAHGTITVLLNDIAYEVTSLRVDSNHDGRRATVDFVNSKHAAYTELLDKFKELGYDELGDYEIEELNQVFQTIEKNRPIKNFSSKK